MAYLNFSEAELSGSFADAFVERNSAPAEATGFAPLEWLVIGFAGRDRLSSLRAPGRFAKAMARLFGTRGSLQLANPRLEAVRRLAVYAWHYGYGVPASALASFRAAGFSTAQAEILIESVIARRANSRARRQA